MDPLLAIGQILVSIALIVAILLQARGVGLSGHLRWRLRRLSQPPRSRAPLWQFTIVLLVLFVVFSLAAFVLAPSPTAPDPGSRRPTASDVHRSSMTVPTRLVVGTLVVLLAIIAGLVGVRPHHQRADRPHRRPDDGMPREPRPYRDGVVGASRPGQPADGTDPGRSRPRRAGLLGAGPDRPGRHASCPTWPSAGRSTPTGGLDLPAPRRRPLARRPAGHR